MDRKQVPWSVDAKLYDTFVKLANDKEIWRGSAQTANKAYESALDAALLCFIERVTPIPTDDKERKQLILDLSKEINLLSGQLVKALT